MVLFFEEDFEEKGWKKNEENCLKIDFWKKIKLKKNYKYKPDGWLHDQDGRDNSKNLSENSSSFSVISPCTSVVIFMQFLPRIFTELH